MFLYLIFAVFCYFYARWLFRPDPEKLLGIYSQRGKWYFLKFHLMKMTIANRQKSSKESKKEENLMEARFGGKGRKIASEMDRKHPLPGHKPRAIDAVFFDASNKEGWYFTLGLAQRQNDLINLFFILRIPGRGSFICQEMLSNNNVPSVRGPVWETESGFRISCEESMRRWKLSFNGNLVKGRGERLFTEVGPLTPEGGDEELFPASFELDWTNFGEAFDFDLECSPTSIAHSLAIEPWSQALFRKLEESHQMHYEQFGFLSGKFHIGGEEYTPNTMTSMRDHTVASYRNWMDLRRYIMMIYHLDDGTCIHTSVISMPETVFTHLEFGYVVTPEKKKIPVDRVYFQLPHHGEDKQFPKQFHYSFDAGELHYEVEVNVIEVESFKMGNDLGTQVNEQMCEYVANGIRGRGFAEVEYRIAPY